MTRRRGASFLGSVVAVLAVVAIAVTGVVVVLNYVVRSPASGTCRADAGGDLTATLDADQAANAALIVGLAQQRDLPIRATTVALSTARQESKLRNIDYGDRDSVGLFQQRPSQGWGTVEEIMDPVYSTGQFYDALVAIDGWEDLEITEAAQAVQRSGFPTAYAQHETMARAFAANLVGQVDAGLTCRLGMPDDAEDATTSLATARVTDLARRDLGLEADGRDSGAVVLDASAMPDGAADPTAAGWGVAHWAVATASETEAIAVATAGQVWLRSDGDDSAWISADALDRDLLPLEQVVVDLAADLGDGHVAIG